MKPGDMIKYRYIFTKKCVDDGELLWSTVEKRWVPIDKILLIVGYNNEVMLCLSSSGLFSVHMNDMFGAAQSCRPIELYNLFL